jgi:hypothetical protein
MGYVEAVEAKGWSLYDITEETRMDDWERREAIGPAETVKNNHGYVLLPQPEPGQGLWKAYEAVQGVGPCLRNPNPEEGVMELWYTPKLALFSRMVLARTGVMLHTPNLNLRKSDKVILPARRAEEIFVRDFDIVSMDEIAKAVQAHRQGRS